MAEQAKDAPNIPGAAPPFDSNCITPGTPFMARLSEVIKFYIQKKIKEDQAWRDVEIIFSGHEVPGEGEHKILEYIRHQKSTDTYNPNLSHCMYGLDADLIMLSLISHEPHFSLIREDDVLKNNRTKSPVASFHFLHISLVREYISLEFELLKRTLPTKCPWDLERLINDFILLCFLVGNDFLPTLPTLNIAEGSLNRIIDAYKQVLPKLGDYLTDRGVINLERLEVFFKHFCEGEEDNFDVVPHGHEKLDRPRNRGPKAQRGKSGLTDSSLNSYRHLEHATQTDLADVLYANRQRDSDAESSEDDDAPSSEDEHSHHLSAPHPRVAAINNARIRDSKSPSSSEENDLRTSTPSSAEGSYNALDHPSAIIKPLSDLSISTDSHPAMGLFGAEDESTPHDLELWKLTYYREKLGMDLNDTAAHDKLRQSYLEGLMWVYHYYMHGCISWSWFFPYHYAPLISDLVQIGKYAPLITFERSQPFKPYQQLLGVLPPKSAPLLPPAYQTLLLSATSPLAPFIPETLEIDREGTKNDWEGVVLLPFMDEKIIMSASESVPLSDLTPAEIKCNMFGNPYTYKYDPSISATVLSPQKELFDDLLMCGSEALVYHHPEPSSPTMYSHIPNQPPLLNSFFLLPGTHLGANKPPTLPTFFSKRLISSLQKNNTRVLQRPAAFDSLVLRITDFDDEVEANRNAGKKIKFIKRDKRMDPVHLDVEGLACQYLGHTVYVWPYNREAKVISVIDDAGFYDENGNIMTAKAGEAKDFPHWAHDLSQFSEQQQAADIGDVRCIFEVQFLNGVSRELDGAIRKQWSERSTLVAFQCVLEHVPFGPDPRFLERPAPSVSVQFPMHSSVLYLAPTGGPMYGAMGTVVEHKDEDAQLSMSIDQQERINPLESTKVIGNDLEKWYGARDISKMTGVTTRFLGRLASSLIFDDKTDLGLQLRFQGRGQQTLTYTRRIETVDRATGQMNSWWEYSSKALELIQEYVKAFPDIFELIANSPTENLVAKVIFRESEAIEKAAEAAQHAETGAADTPMEEADSPSDSEDDEDDDDAGKKKKKRGAGRVGFGPQFIRQRQMLEWLAHHRPSKSLRIACGTIGLDRAVITKLESAMDEWMAAHPEPTNPRTRIFTVPRTQAFSPLPPLEVLHKNNVDAVGKQDFKLGERAVFILDSGAVPFGTAGTIVTVSKTHVEILLDAPCVGGTDLSGRCSHRRGISVPHGAILNVTAPVRRSETSLRSNGSVKPAWTSGNSSDRIRNSGELRNRQNQDQQLRDIPHGVEHGQREGPRAQAGSGHRGGRGGGGHVPQHARSHQQHSDDQHGQQQHGQQSRRQQSQQHHEKSERGPSTRGGHHEPRGGHTASSSSQQHAAASQQHGGHAAPSQEHAKKEHPHAAYTKKSDHDSAKQPPKEQREPKKTAKNTSSSAPSSSSSSSNAHNPSAKKIAAKPTAASGGHAQAPKGQKQEAKRAATEKSEPSGKPVAVGELFAPVASASAAPAPSETAVPIPSIPGVTLDPHQLSFFSALSAGHGSTFAQQNMPSVPQPAYGMPYPMMMPPSLMGVPPAYVQQQQPAAARGIDALFQSAPAPTAKAVPLDSLLPKGQ